MLVDKNSIPTPSRLPDVNSLVDRAKKKLAETGGTDFRAALWTVTDGLDHLDKATLQKLRIKALAAHAQTRSNAPPSPSIQARPGSSAPVRLQPVRMTQARKLLGGLHQLPWAEPSKAADQLAGMLGKASPAERNLLIKEIFSQPLMLGNFTPLLDRKSPQRVSEQSRTVIAQAVGRAYEAGAIDDGDLDAAVQVPGQPRLHALGTAVSNSGSLKLQIALARALLRSAEGHRRTKQERLSATAETMSGSPEAAMALIKLLTGPDGKDPKRLDAFVRAISPKAMSRSGSLANQSSMANWLTAASQHQPVDEAMPLFRSVATRIGGQVWAENAVANFVDAVRSQNSPRALEVFLTAVDGLDESTKHTSSLDTALTRLFVNKSDSFLAELDPRTRDHQFAMSEFMSRSPFAGDEGSRAEFMEKMRVLVQERIARARDPALPRAQRIAAAEELGMLMGSMRLGFKTAAKRDADRVAGSNGFIAWAVNETTSRVGAALPIPSSVVGAGSQAITTYLQQKPLTVGELHALIAPLDARIRQELSGMSEVGLHYTNVWDGFDFGNANFIYEQGARRRND